VAFAGSGQRAQRLFTIAERTARARSRPERIAMQSITANELQRQYSVVRRWRHRTPPPFRCMNMAGTCRLAGHSNDCQSPATPCATTTCGLARWTLWQATHVRLQWRLPGAASRCALETRCSTLSGGGTAHLQRQTGISVHRRRGRAPRNYRQRGVMAYVDRFRIQGGHAICPMLGLGGCIHHSGTLNLSNSIVSDSTADCGGGSSNSGSMSLEIAPSNANVARGGAGSATRRALTLTIGHHPTSRRRYSTILWRFHHAEQLHSECNTSFGNGGGIGSCTTLQV